MIIAAIAMHHAMKRCIAQSPNATASTVCMTATTTVQMAVNPRPPANPNAQTNLSHHAVQIASICKMTQSIAATARPNATHRKSAAEEAALNRASPAKPKIKSAAGVNALARMMSITAVPVKIHATATRFASTETAKTNRTHRPVSCPIQFVMVNVWICRQTT